MTALRRSLIARPIALSSFLAVALILLSLTPSNIGILSKHRYHHISTRYVTSSGLVLAAFFEQLQPNAGVRERVIDHKNNRDSQTCRQSSGFVSQFFALIGVGQVVHAQTCPPNFCTNCPGAVVDEISCSECDGTDAYSYEWFGEIESTGWRYNGHTSCTGDVCCYMEECSC
jgi:hypothetical protein